MFDTIQDSGSITKGEVWQVTYGMLDSDGTAYTGETLVGATGELEFRTDPQSATEALDASAFVSFPAASQVAISIPSASSRTLVAGTTVVGNLFVTPIGSGLRFLIATITLSVLPEITTP